MGEAWSRWRVVMTVNGTDFFEATIRNKGEPGIAKVVRENTADDGCVAPCFWSSRWPGSKALRADYVVFYEELLAGAVEADDPPGSHVDPFQVGDDD